MDGRGGLRAAVSRSALRLQSDRRLVALTRGGSGAAFAVIVERYRAPLLTYCKRMLGPDEAEDALQQTFANALTALRRDGREIDLRPWLYRISHNIAVNALRRKGRDTEPLDEQYDGVPQPPDILDEKLRLERLVRDLEALPERQRTAIVAHELEGRSYEEIARSMSATTPIVRQLVHRARTRLRDACGVLVPAWALRSALCADPRVAAPDRLTEAAAGGVAGSGLFKAGTALLATGAIATGAGTVVTHDQRRATGDRPDAVRVEVAPSPQVATPESPPVTRSSAPKASASESRSNTGRDPGNENGHGRAERGSTAEREDEDRDDARGERPRRGHDEDDEHDRDDDVEPQEPRKASHEDREDEPDEGPEKRDSSGPGSSGQGGDSEGEDPAESGEEPGPSPDRQAEP